MRKLSFGITVCLLTVLSGCVTSPSLPSLPKLSLPTPDLAALPNPLARFKRSPANEATLDVAARDELSDGALDAGPIGEERIANAGVTRPASSWRSALSVNRGGEASRPAHDDDVQSRIAAMEALASRNETEAAKLLYSTRQEADALDVPLAGTRPLDQLRGTPGTEKNLLDAARESHNPSGRGFWSRLWNRDSGRDVEQLAGQPTLLR